MERIIGELNGEEKGPLLIFVGGLHGNEAQGLIALENVFNNPEMKTHQLAGRAVALRGNLQAINENKRFISKDLNRIWTDAENMKINGEAIAELEEYEAIKNAIEAELNGDYTEAYLIDLHTTSAPTIPFAVTKNVDNNRRLIEKIDIPYITGLEGYLDGTLLSWMCEKGHCGLAFEAGQHHSRTSMIKHEAFVQLVMYNTGFIKNLAPHKLFKLQDLLDEEMRPKHNHFVLIQRYKIEKEEEFVMEEGFSNFERVYKGEVLAKNQHGEILSDSDANIFMPLYQKQGNDGFFIIKPYIQNGI